MEITRKTFVACSAAALATMPAAVALASEAPEATGVTADAPANEPEGYTFYETESGLSVTVADDEDPALPTVVVLATGGTIAGTGEAGKTTGYAAGQLDVGTLVNSAAGILEIANVRGAQVCNVGSDDITDAYWIQIANTINELASDDAIAGFVVTHGTDTLEETAYFLNLAAKTQKPVVLTGAMRPSTATSADGPMNLYQSIALAANPEAAGRGAMVVFSDGIYGGRDVQKINTFKTDAFNGRDMGCLGYMQDANACFFNATTKAHTVDTEFDVAGLEGLPPVAVAYAAPEGRGAAAPGPHGDQRRRRTAGDVQDVLGGGRSAVWPCRPRGGVVVRADELRGFGLIPPSEMRPNRRYRRIIKVLARWVSQPNSNGRSIFTGLRVP